MPKYIDADSLYERLEKRYHQIVESYHEHFWAFEDDCLTVCEDSTEAAAFIEKLRIEEYKRLQPPQL